MKKIYESGKGVCHIPKKLLLVMKLTAFLIVVLTMQVTATVYSQNKKLSLNMQGNSIKEVLQQIEAQSEYRFIYENEKVNLDTKVSIQVTDEVVDKILKQLFEKDGINYSITDNKLILINPSDKQLQSFGEEIINFQQQKSVSGKVTDSTGGSLPGVSVVVKGTINGTITDSEGNYSLANIPANATLQFSFVGMKMQEIAVGSNSTINVTLTEETIGIDEVVAIGYGTQRKKEVSGAVAQIGGERLTLAPISTLTNTLTGRMAGLLVSQSSAEPGRESTSIMIRGASTFGDNKALIVIDGIANADGLDRLNPNEIESVSILKDASAAIYGAQAANGVVLVTTKRGKKTGAPVFNYSGNIGFNSPTSLQKVSNGLEYATYVNRLTWSDAAWNPNYTPIFSASSIDNIKNGVTPTYEWLNSTYKNWFSQTNHNISVSGGSDKIKYFVSGRYLNQGSIFEGDEVGENKQYNLRSNLDFNFIDNLDIGLDIALRQQDVANNIQRRDIITNALLTSPLLGKYVNDDPRYPAAARWNKNPIAMQRAKGYAKDDVSNQTIIGNFTYRIPKLDGLALGGFASVALHSKDTKNFNKPWTFYKPNPSDPSGTPVAEIFNKTTLNQEYYKSRLVTGNFHVTYVKTFGGHNFDGLLQVEKQTQRIDYYGAGKDNFLSPASDFLNSGSPSRDDSYAYGAAEESARINYSGRVNYNYKGKYMLQALFRYDGSEKFAEGKRFGFFPGVSGAWLISEEGFLKNSPILSSLKIKGSWGRLGNDRIPSFNYLSRFVFGNNTVVNGKTVTGVVESGSSNPDVTWEVTESTNLGVEATLKKLWFEVNLFDMQTKNILADPQLTLPEYTGITPPKQNIGKHQNRGFEIETMYRDNIGKFNFAIGGNIAHTKNKIVFFDEPPYDEAYQNLTGHPYGAALMYHAIGIFRTQDELKNLPTRPGDRLGSVIIQDSNNDGKITIKDRIRQDKTSMPNWIYGITTHFSYRNFDFDMLWQGTSGSTRNLSVIFSNGNNGLAFLANNTWDPDHIDAKYPAPNQGGDTDFYQLTNNYIRLKTLEIGYTIPERVTHKIGLNSLRIYFSGYNLLTFDTNSELGFTDPEQTDNLGWDYPNLKTVNLGINLSF